jgi:hypothetical protein
MGPAQSARGGLRPEGKRERKKKKKKKGRKKREKWGRGTNCEVWGCMSGGVVGEK